MELLYTLDEKNYTEDMPLVERHGIRGLVRRGRLWAMQYAPNAEYKIPGGGQEPGESDMDTLKREIAEETGLTVLENTVKAFGEILEKRADIYDKTKRYIAHSRYYLCEVAAEAGELKMTPHEIEKGYRLEWADLDTIISNNEKMKAEYWLDRDLVFLKWLRNHEELWAD